MTLWSDLSTGQRIKSMRGKDTTQVQLAEMTNLALVTIQKAEQDKALTLPTLMAISNALDTQPGVLLGHQEPEQQLHKEDRAMMRALSRTVHDTAAGMLPHTDEEPPSCEELQAAVTGCWELYWAGKYGAAGAMAGPLLSAAAARLHAQPVGMQAEAAGLLSDAYRIAAYTANLLGARDLAYAAIGHAHVAAERAADDLRVALVGSGRAWVYLRDARLAEALSLAEKAANDIEPRFSTATPVQLTVYGSHVNFAAVVASRMGNKERAADFLSQSNGIGARMGAEVRAHGTLFGPVSAVTQAVGINVALGQTGKALTLIKSIHDVEPLTEAAQNRYAMDKAMAQADAKQWDESLDTLEKTLRAAPDWARHQALPRVIADKVGTASTAKLRRVAKLISPRGGYSAGFLPATEKTAL